MWMRQLEEAGDWASSTIEEIVNFSYKLILVITPMLIIAGIGLFIYMREPNTDSIVQRENLRQAIHDEIVELDIANGNVVWIEDSIKKEVVVEVAVKEADWFNSEVDAKREDYKAKFTTGISPAFRHRVDIYYVEEDGKRAIFIVPEGSKVKSNYKKIN